MMNRSARAPRGFTLIELMIVVAIIGLLASMAIPMVTSFTYRAKKSERNQTMKAIARAMQEYYTQNEKFPGLAFPGFSFTFLPPNPPLGGNGAKHQFDKNLGAGMGRWSDIVWNPEGFVYYQYQVWAQASPGLVMIEVGASSDLDRDNQRQQAYLRYQLKGDIWEPYIWTIAGGTTGMFRTEFWEDNPAEW